MKLITAVFVILLFMVLIVSSSWAITWMTANQTTMAWSPVTTYVDENGNDVPLPADNVIKYSCVMKDSVTGVELPALAETDQTECTFVFDPEGGFYLGVAANRYAPIGEGGALELVGTSVTAWSNDPGYVDPTLGVFGIRYFRIPATPTGLMIQ